MLALTSLVAAASYYPAAPANDSATDTLYTVVAVVGMLLLFALAASFVNARETGRGN